MAPPKHIRQRALAVSDAELAFDWYFQEAGPDVAERFVDALEAAFSHIARYPGTGSPRWAHALGVSDLRAWSLKNCPYLVFYVEVGEHIEVWRVLHSARDIPAWIIEGH